MKSWVRTILYFAATIIITAAITVTITVSKLNEKRSDEVILTPDEYSRLSDLKFLDEIAERIKVDALKEAPERDKLLESAARGMISAISDPYADYFTQEEYDAYLSSVNGQYDGIGISVSQPDANGVTVLKVYENAPCAKAGVLAGDVITHIDGASLAGLSADAISSMLNKDVGSAVELTLVRDGVTLTLSPVSESLSLKQVSYALFNQRTGYIRIDKFTGNCVEEFKEALKDLTYRGMRSLVIDLRSNPGGALDYVIKIADMVMESGTIVSVRNEYETEGELYTARSGGINVPLAVIVNESTASASEIFAGAIQDNSLGMIVGMTTYGKGVVQTTTMLKSNHAWLKLTTDAYYTPSGRNIDGVGITPDIEVDLPDELLGMPIDQLEQDTDAQLWAALDYVRAEVEAAS